MPNSRYSTVVLAHGGGGRLMHDLLERMILPAFANPALAARHDGAAIRAGSLRLAFTTDSFVVSPHRFPGGDIGVLAVHGTLNDLAMCGARPLALSAALILEEGFSMAELQAVIQSMAGAARRAGVDIVTGDTKVVERGKGDGLYVTTAGVGVIEHDATIDPQSVRRGDAIVVSGDLGRHGIAVMAAREGLRFETTLESDTAFLWPQVDALLQAGVEIHGLRDLTRGGLAGALVEIAEAGAVPIEIEEDQVPVCEEVRGACEILGLDPMFVANEGRFVAFVPSAQADRAVSILRSLANASNACRLGSVRGDRAGTVTARTALGTLRVVDMFSGEQLPRIC
ncbi:MAG: hydrogenase expression/formation protein HypE [Planctomycetota bacterium]